MKTKIFILLLAVAASIGTMHAAIVNGTCGDNLTWSLDTQNRCLIVEGEGSMHSWSYPSVCPWNDYKSYIDSVSLPDGLTSIGESAFENCSNLRSVRVPNTIVNIGNFAFGGTHISAVHFCGSIEDWCVKPWSAAFFLDYYNLYINENLVTNISISNSITELGNDAFDGCKSLRSIDIPNGVTSIGNNAFNGCSYLTSITIPSSVTRIGNDAFAGCINLSSVLISSTSAWCGITFENKNANPLIYAHSLYLDSALVTQITFPATISNIANYVFYGCTSLKSIYIPNNITNIGKEAFSGCNSLNNITCEVVSPPSISSNTFSKKTAILFVPAESVEAYQNALYWEEFTDIRAIGSAPLVQFLDWDGTILSSANVTIGTAATAPADPTRTGYTFIGWDKDFSNITEDLVVTAQYKINRYEVIFKDWDETILKSDSVDYNTAATAPVNPSREGHEFIGWDKDFSHVSSDMIINARYTVNYYPVGFLNYDGTLLSEQSIAYNQAAMEPNVPTRGGYTFIGWTADIEHITARTFAIALYEKDGINVTYISEEGDTIVSEKVDMHLPDAPIVSGKTFTGWLTESASNAEGIVFRATYTLDNPTTGEDVVVIPTSSTAGVSFPYITGAMTYMLVIRDLFGTVVCKIMFDADGHLLGIAFAPGGNRTQKAQSECFHFTVEGLTPGTTYEYEFVAYDEADQVIETLTGSFETTADETGVNNISSASAPQKVINDGHVFVLRGDKTYTMQGQEVR